MTEVTWTVKSSLEWTQQYLATKAIENPRLAAQWLLAAATGLSRLELYTNYDLPLDSAQLAVLREGIKRRLAGEPLQYILGKAAFRRLELQVRPGVLIPRPETELLVQLALDWIAAEFGDGLEDLDGFEPAAEPVAGFGGRQENADGLGLGSEDGKEPSLRTARVLDLCTGTGCVALSLLYERPGLHVVATDIDPVAIGLAVENAAMLGLDGQGRLLAPDQERPPSEPQPPVEPLPRPPGCLRIIQDDLGTSLLGDPAYQSSFDVIVANPPYIPTAELAKLPNEIANYEPKLALDGGEDGLSVYRRILQQARQLLRPGGLLACELHEATLAQAKAIAEEHGFHNAQIINDLAGRPRIISMMAPDSAADSAALSFTNNPFELS